jgi:hypothetical protein
MGEQYPEFDRIFANIGNPTVSQGSVVYRAVDWNERHRSTLQIARELQPKFNQLAGVTAFPITPPSLGFRERPINFVVQTSDSYANLNRVMRQLMDEVSKNPGFVAPDLDLRLSKPELRIDVDRERAADLGVPVESVARAIETLLGSRNVTRYKRDAEQYDVTVQLEAGSLSITGSALVSTTSLGTNGRAGDLLVNVGELTIDGGGAAAGLRSLGWGAFAQPGDMVVNVRQGLSVRNGGALMVTTLGRGRPGSLTVNAGSVLIDGSGSPDTATGIGGDSVEIEGQVVAGAASPVNVTAQRIDIRPNGTISSSTSTDVDAGAVRVVADTLRIDGGGNAGKLTGIGSDSTSGHGNAGSVSVQARQIDLLAEGQISSLAVDGSGRLDGPARGGQVQVRADTLTLTGTSGIYSLAGTAGGAGSVDVAVTHGLFIGDAVQRLTEGGVRHVWSTDSVPHASNCVSVAPLLAAALRETLS